MDTAAILQYFDRRFDAFEMPCLGNMNIDFVDIRMQVHAGPDGSWIVLFNSIVWWPACEGLMSMLEVIGPGVAGKQGFDNDRAFTTGEIVVDIDDDDEEAQALRSVSVRGEPVALDQLPVEPDLDTHGEIGFWAAVALLPTHRERLFATEAEIAPLIPPGFRQVLQLDAWEHPDFGVPPSKTETFRALAAAIASGDYTQVDRCAKPNTHWSNWQPK